MKKLNLLFAGLLVCGALFMSSCNETNDNPVKPTNTTGIPNDADAKPNPILDPSSLNTTIPNFNWTYSYENGELVIRLDLTGVKDPYTDDWVELYGMESAKQNIWVSVDGISKGFTIEKINDQKKGTVDMIFLVDNSTSMREEAEGVAKEIKKYANELNSKMDILFGCVGYGRYVGYEYDYPKNNYGVSGALNLSSYEQLDAFLNQRGKTGVDRTVGYFGDDANKLSSAAAKDEYYKSGGENSIQALRFADENFSFTTGANRVYVNFTDDANYPGGNKNISISYVENTETWPVYKGTIHSVISNSEDIIINRSKQVSDAELSYLPSDYTGGTKIFVPSDFSGVSLSSLPVTGALLNSYIIRFRNVPLDGRVHEVWLTVKSTSPNGEILADKKSEVIFQ